MDFPYYLFLVYIVKCMQSSMNSKVLLLCARRLMDKQGTKLTSLARLQKINFFGKAPKFSKVVAKAKTLGAIKKKKIARKTHYIVMSNERVFLALNLSACATKKDISIHNIQTFGKSKMADVDMFGS